MNRIARLIALPVLAAGIVAGALGMAGTASAASSIDSHGGIVATPDVHAHQAMMYPRTMYPGAMYPAAVTPGTIYLGTNGYYWPNQASAPHVDNTVHQSR